MTVEACSRAIRRLGEYFDQRIDALTEAQLLEYFSDLVESHSWSTVKLDLYGLTFYCEHVHKKPWLAPGLIKPPRSQRLPDILTVTEADRLLLVTLSRHRVHSDYATGGYTLRQIGDHFGLHYSVGCRIALGVGLDVQKTRPDPDP